jgi:hypothetical protein
MQPQLFFEDLIRWKVCVYISLVKHIHDYKCDINDDYVVVVVNDDGDDDKYIDIVDDNNDDHHDGWFDNIYIYISKFIAI